MIGPIELARQLSGGQMLSLSGSRLALDCSSHKYRSVQFEISTENRRSSVPDERRLPVVTGIAQLVSALAANADVVGSTLRFISRLIRAHLSPLCELWS